MFRRVTEPIHGTNRSVTCDNWFTSVPLVERMITSPYDLKVTGTIRSNKREIPLEMKIPGEAQTAKYCINADLTLLSWTPKRNKIVLLLSSLIKAPSVSTTNGKPPVIEYYNATKGGTDTFDQLCHSYTVTRISKRWPVRFFFGILDQAIVNSRILYLCTRYSDDQLPKISAREWQKNIAMYLIKPHLQQRLTKPSLRLGLRKSIECIMYGDVQPIAMVERPQFDKRVRCGLCDRKSDHKTTLQCPSCRRAMCDKHRAYLCNYCVLNLK